eukprot:s2433_g4.t1
MSIFWAVRVERRSSLEQKWRGMSLPVNPECGNNVVQVDVLGTVGSFHNKTLVAGNIWQWGILFRRACGARPGAMWRMRGLRPTDVGGIQRVQSEGLVLKILCDLLNNQRLRDAALVAFGLCRDSPTCSHQGAGRPFAENPSASAAALPPWSWHTRLSRGCVSTVPPAPVSRELRVRLP